MYTGQMHQREQIQQREREREKDKVTHGNCDLENAFRIMKEWQSKSSGTWKDMNSTLLVQ